MASASEIKAGAAYVELSLKDSKFAKGLKTAQKKLRGMGQSLVRLSRGALIAGGLVTGAITASLGVFSKYGDQLDKISKRTGVSVEKLSELEFAADRSGASIEDLEKAFKAQASALQEAERGSKTYVDSLNDLGLSYEDLRGLSPDQQFELIAQRLSEIDDPSRRAALAVDFFGRAGQKLLPLLNTGAAGIRAFGEEARRLGLVIDKDATDKAAKLTDVLGDLRSQLRAVLFNIGAAVAGPVTKFLRMVSVIATKVINWVKANGRLVRAVALVGAAVLGIGGALLALGIAFQVVAFSIGGLIAVMSLAGTIIGAVGAALAFLLSPLGLIIVGVVAVAAVVITKFGLIGRAIEKAKGIVKGLAVTFGPALQSIRDSLAAGDIESAAKVLWAAIRLVWAGGVSEVLTLWGRAKGKIISIAVNIGTRIEEVFRGLAFGMVEIWSKITDSIAKAFNRIYGFFDRGFDADAANAFIDEDAAADSEARLEAIGKKFNELKKERDDASGLGAILGEQEKKKAAAELELAKKDLVDAIERAKKAREGAGQGGPSPLDPVVEQLASIATKFTSKGSFSGRVAAGFGSGVRLESRIATASEASAKSLKKIERNTEQSVLRYN